MDQDGRRRVIRTVAGDALANLFLQGFAAGAILLAGWVLSRLLGADGLGIYAFGMSLAGLLAAGARLGLLTLVVRQVAVYRQREDWGSLRGIARWSQLASALASVGIGAGTLAVAWFSAAPETWWTLVGAMGLMGVMASTNLRAAALRGINAVVLASVPVLLVRPAVFLLGLLALTLAGSARPSTAMAVHLGAWMVSLAVVHVAWSLRRPAEASLVAATYQPRLWLLAALPFLVLDGLQIITTQADVLMLKGLASDASTGIYSIIAQIGRFAALVLVVVNLVVIPRFAALSEAGKKEELQHLVGVCAAAVTAVTGVIAVLLIVFGQWGLGLYAPGFDAGYPALVVLVVGQSLNAMAGSVGYLLVMTGHERDVAIASGVTAVVNVGLNLVLIPRYDMLGAAVASALALVMWNVSLMIRTRMILGIDTTVVGWLRGWWR